MPREWPPTHRQRATWQAIVAVNEQPWQPLPGMEKVRCRECGLWYARPMEARGIEWCPDCQLSQQP